MALIVHRAHRVERLVEALAAFLDAHRPTDPFEPVPVLVGSRAMASWLRHELATRRGVAAGLLLPLPRRGITAAVTACLNRAPAIRIEPDRSDPFDPDPLALRLLEILHAEKDGAPAEFARAITTREEDGAVVADRRAFAFARQVAQVLDRLLYEAPDLAGRLADRGRPVETFLARLLRAAGALDHPESPVVRHHALSERAAAPAGRAPPHLLLFGISTLRPGDRARLRRLARILDVHLFSVVPTPHFFLTGPHARAGEHPENPLLAALGHGSRALLDLVTEEEGFDLDVRERDHFAEAPAPASLLHRLQRWIFDAGPLPEPGAPRWAADDSITFHAAPGALRQCEVVRDLLMAAFAEDPTLMPRDVVIQTPQPAVYAPLLSLVLGRRVPVEATGRQTDPEARVFPAIPVAVSDLGLRERNVAAQVLLTLLALAAGRLRAPDAADLFGLEAVRRALDVPPDGAETFARLLAESGFTWGADAEDRQHTLDAADWMPAGARDLVDDHGSARFAAGRLALGAAQHDPDPLWVQPAPPPLATVAPVEAPAGTPQRLAASLAMGLRMLERTRERLTRPRTAEAWARVLAETLDAWCDLPPEQAFLRREIDDVLDAFARDGEGAAVRLEVGAVLDELERRCDRPLRAGRPATGAVTISGLEPMRVVPFRLVVLVGMDDGAFPRTEARPSWDPLAGDPRVLARADVDRHILLEAILSARDRLVVTFSGRDPHTNEPRPAAVPIEELVATLGTLTGAARSELVVEHPLQPYARRAFEPGPTQSPDPGFFAIAQRLERLRTGGGAPAARADGLWGAYDTLRLPPPPAAAAGLDLRELTSWLYRPNDTLVRQRLALWPDRAAPEPPDVDPTDAGALDRAHAAALFEDLLAGRDVAVQRVHRRLCAEGQWVPGAAGRGAFDDTVRALSAFARAIEALEPATVSLPVHVAWPDRPTLPSVADTLTGLVGRHDGAATLLLPLHGTKTPSSYVKLRAMVIALVLAARPGEAATAAPVEAVALCAFDPARRAAKITARPLPPPDVARALLEDLVAVAARAALRPLPLFPKMSEAIATGLVGRTKTSAFKGQPPEAVLDRLRQAAAPSGPAVTEIAWADLARRARNGLSGRRGASDDLADDAVAALFAGYDPGQSILARRHAAEEIELAVRVWGRVRWFWSNPGYGTTRTPAKPSRRRGAAGGGPP